ncbi:MAG: hypothetical protein JW778_04495 [Candidatus Altiarchaeota archaeon]|nr:hypothetical protein [Candidatus Altiarchaeota archaeon]
MNSIHLFVTTRKDPVQDLDSFEDYHQIKRWEKEVRPHALKYKLLDGVTEKLIDELMGIEILECYAIVLYPEGKMIEADDLIAEDLLNLLREHKNELNWRLQETGRSMDTIKKMRRDHVYDSGRFWENFTYSLLKDPELGEGDFEVYLEVVTQ